MHDGICDVFASAFVPYHLGRVPQSLQSLSHKCTDSLYLEVTIIAYKGGHNHHEYLSRSAFHFISIVIRQQPPKTESEQTILHLYQHSLHLHRNFAEARCRGRLSPPQPWRWRGSWSGESAKTATAARTRTRSASRA